MHQYYLQALWLKFHGWNNNFEIYHYQISIQFLTKNVAPNKNNSKN